jgi:hypothetical protein
MPNPVKKYRNPHSIPFGLPNNPALFVAVVDYCHLDLIDAYYQKIITQEPAPNHPLPKP